MNSFIYMKVFGDTNPVIFNTVNPHAYGCSQMGLQSRDAGTKRQMQIQQFSLH